MSGSPFPPADSLVFRFLALVVPQRQKARGPTLVDVLPSLAVMEVEYGGMGCLGARLLTLLFEYKALL
jgi:hypothetical protein